MLWSLRLCSLACPAHVASRGCRRRLVTTATVSAAVGRVGGGGGEGKGWEL